MSELSHKLWQNACGTLMAPGTEESWKMLEEVSPPNTVWHSLKNCVAHQAGVWMDLLSKGLDDVMQPAAFKLAMVLRHTPSNVVTKLLKELLSMHPQSEDLTAYVIALLTDDESNYDDDEDDEIAITNSEGKEIIISDIELPPVYHAPLRDVQLFGDCELAVLAAPRDQYDAHSKLVRAEYSKMTTDNYLELRLKVLRQFSQLPKLFHTPEFEFMERGARENIDREILSIRAELLAIKAE